MSEIRLDIPDITVVVSEGEQYVSSIQTADTITQTDSNYYTVADTAATAITSSYALTAETLIGLVETASYATFAATASYVSGVASDWNTLENKPTGIVSASIQTVSHISSSDIQPSSVQSNTVLLNAGGVTLIFTGSINQGIFGVSEYIEPYINTEQYSGMTVEYLAQRPGACRMGIILASWLNTGSVTFTDVSTTDIGDTGDISFRFISSSNELRLRVNSAGSGSGAWTVQSLFKMFPNLLS